MNAVRASAVAATLFLAAGQVVAQERVAGRIHLDNGTTIDFYELKGWRGYDYDSFSPTLAVNFHGATRRIEPATLRMVCVMSYDITSIPAITEMRLVTTQMTADVRDIPASAVIVAERDPFSGALTHTEYPLVDYARRALNIRRIDFVAQTGQSNQAQLTRALIDAGRRLLAVPSAVPVACR